MVNGNLFDIFAFALEEIKFFWRLHIKKMSEKASYYSVFRDYSTFQNYMLRKKNWDLSGLRSMIFVPISK